MVYVYTHKCRRICADMCLFDVFTYVYMHTHVCTFLHVHVNHSTTKISPPISGTCWVEEKVFKAIIFWINHIYIRPPWALGAERASTRTWRSRWLMPWLDKHSARCCDFRLPDFAIWASRFWGDFFFFNPWRDIVTPTGISEAASSSPTPPSHWFPVCASLSAAQWRGSARWPYRSKRLHGVKVLKDPHWH